MINNDKWINSLPKTNTSKISESLQIDHNKWVSTIPKKNTNSSVKKYSLMLVLFMFGLLIIPVVKNETRILEKEINYLKASINLIEFNLKQANLDNEVLTSPENVSKLAKEYLDADLSFYKKSQIKNLNKNEEIVKKISIKKNEKKLKNFKKNIKNQVATKIYQKKREIEKLQDLYNDPKSIPGEVKTKVAKQIEEKKFELKNLYDSPKDLITLKRVGKWGAVQVVKAALGMPIIPGR